MAQVITGAKALVTLSGNLFAFAAGVSITHENRLEEIPQLDNLEVAEYAENGHRCAVALTSMKLLDGSNSAFVFGLDDPDDLKKILLQPELIIQIVDDQDNVYYTAYGCKFEGGTGQVDARGIWQGNWNFKARRGTGI